MSEPAPPGTGALAGLLVIAIEQAVAAPLCTLRLADAGARVIKIERLDGDTARHYDTAVNGQSAYFVWLNRGKESAALDLKTTDDLALLHAMIAKADVLVQNLAPGALDRLGLAQEVLESRFPRLIAASIVGYGHDTDYANMRAYDMLVQAESGLCSVTGTPEEPVKVGVSAADIGTGMAAHAAILEAIIARERTGQGRLIEIAMFDTMADWMAVPLLHLEHAGRETRRHGLAHASIYPYRPYTCRGGQTVVIAIQQPAEWSRFCTRVLNRPELIADSRFITNSDRLVHRVALDAEIEPVFAALERADAIARLDAAQIAWGRLSEVHDLAGHSALRRLPVLLSDGREVTVPRPPGRTGREPAQARVPGLGQDTARLREEFAP